MSNSTACVGTVDGTKHATPSHRSKGTSSTPVPSGKKTSVLRNLKPGALCLQCDSALFVSVSWTSASPDDCACSWCARGLDALKTLRCVHDNSRVGDCMSDETHSVLRKWKSCLAHRSWHLQPLERADIELDQTHREGQHVSSTSGSCPHMDRCPVHPGYVCCFIVCHAREAQTRMSPRLSFSVEQTEVQLKHGGHPRHRLPLQRATSTLVDPLETGKEVGERPQ